ncbi:MAG: ParB/RepB/Spo0J family partition protein [Lachnospiraceae bacterium]|nr:ParB/RepB/Spo0J family partition protein [Lachnospiraceae bacterium]
MLNTKNTGLDKTQKSPERKRMGRGIDALIGGKENTPVPKEQEGSVVKVKISKVEPNRDQPRKLFNEDALQDLADSIKQVGLLQPILVQDRKDYYEIIAGERRWRAANIAGLKEVPVIIGHFTEQEIVEIALIENIQREDLNPIEEAQAYKRLLEEFNLKQDEVAERVSKSRTAVTNSIRLLKLCDEVQQMVIDEMISTGHARALLAVDDKEQQYILAQKVFDEKLSVREVEKLVRNLGKTKTQKTKQEKQLSDIYQQMEGILKERFSTKVNIVGKENGSGRVEIEFFSHEELDRLMDILTK